METPASASLEKPEDAGKGGEGIVRRWLMEMELADKREVNWRKRAEKVLIRYGDETERRNNRFNILWANTEILKAALYNSTPRPDARGRFKKDKIAKIGAEILEDALRNTMDEYDFDHVMDLTVLDICLPGRGVPRIVFEPKMQTVTGQDGQSFEKLVYAKLYCDHVQWDQIRIGPGKKWSDVPWVAFEHLLTRESLDALGDKGKMVELDCEMQDRPENHQDDSDDSVFKRGRVWEIWDKDTQKVIFIAPSYKDGPVKEEDGLGLTGFFPIPRPVYSIYRSNTLVPIEEYRLYKDQADELDRVTQRINKLVEGLKVRGIYDATLTEMSKLRDAGDNELIPSDTALQAIQQNGGNLDSAIWMMPIEVVAKVLQQLYLQREQLKATIYEITGLSDIMRGESDPNETLGAQELKAQNGSMRIKKRQREVQRMIRDLLRMKAEIIAEHYTPEMLQMMTGVEVEPEVLLQTMQLMKQDLSRNFRIDIETDSTIAADQSAERADITELLTGMSQFVGAVGPAVQEGALPMEAAKAMLLAIVSKFKMGRVLEDALDDIENQPQQPEKPDPEMLKMQAEQQKAQGEMQLKQAQMQADAEAQQMKVQSDAQAMQMKLEAENQAMQMKLAADERVAQAKLASDAAIKQQELEFEKEKFYAELALKRELGHTGIEADKENKARQVEASSKPTTTLQLDTEGAMDEAVEKITEIAEANSKGIAEALTMMAQALEKMNMPKRMIRDANGYRTETIQ